MNTPSASSRFSTRGFTLIELLTVIAIIGILAAIIIPTVGKVRESARSAQCVSNQRQINMALQLYVEDNKGFLPASNRPKLQGETGSGSSVNWAKSLGPYLPQKGSTTTANEHPIFSCGSAEFNGRRGDLLSNTYTSSAVLLGLNSNGQPTEQAVRRALSTVDASRLSKIPVILEGKANGAFFSTFPSTNWTTVLNEQGKATFAETTRFDFRHGGRLNVAYMDGSVRGMNFTEFKDLDRDLYEGLRSN